MIEVTASYVLREGITTPTPTVADGTDVFLLDNDGNIITYIENTSSGALTATVVTTAEVAGQALADTDIEIGAGSGHWAGPWPPVLFNQTDDSVLFQLPVGLRISALGI